MKVTISQQMRDIAAQVADVARSPDSKSGRTITGNEMKAYLAVLDADGRFSSADKSQALSDFAGAKLDRAARVELYQRTGVMPTPIDPIDPPIVALYAVAINDAIRNETDLNRLKALAHGTELSLESHGGSGRVARPMALSASSAASINVGPQSAHVTEVRAALTALKARIAELEN